MAVTIASSAPLQVLNLRWQEVRIGTWELALAAVPEGLCGLALPGRHEQVADWLSQRLIVARTEQEDTTEISRAVERMGEHLHAGIQWLNRYRGGTIDPVPPLVLVGTGFQRAVWQALLHIPVGTTWSYGEVAARVGSPRASRAVGQAVGANPLSILVPCHRVVGSNGKLVGFGGGLALKEELLEHEASG